jgi:hypothetical protein
MGQAEKERAKKPFCCVAHRRRTRLQIYKCRRAAAVGNGDLILSNPEWSLTMKHVNFRNAMNTAALIGATIVTSTALAQPAQGGNGPGYGMMGGNGPGWMGGYGAGWMGGYGGIWLPILLVIVVAGLVAWIVKQKGK